MRICNLGIQKTGEIVEVLWIRFFGAIWIFNPHVGNAQADQGQAHRHAVVVVGVDLCAVQRAGRDAQAVGKFVDRGAELRSSIARFPIRSVSLWRMWATPVMVVGPSANRATAASVCTVSLMAFISTLMPRRYLPRGGPITVIVLSGRWPVRTSQPICSKQSQNATSPCRLSRFNPSTVTSPPVIGRGGEEIAGGRCVGFDFVTIQTAILAWRDPELLKIDPTAHRPRTIA